jgi:16S rRNA (cytosine1402-N4)-methyltransferase
LETDAPHVPVMPEECIEALRVRPDGIYVDGTAGAGGHSLLIAQALDGGRLISLDRDPDAVALAGSRLSGYPQALVVQANYSELSEVLRELGIGRVDGVLIDAGCSSMQLDRRERGFSFEGDGPLDMRMDPGTGESAAEMLRGMGEEEMVAMLKQYGDLRPARRIARAIRVRAEHGRLSTTLDLVEAVREALPFVAGVPDEVRTVFQAVRIAVNDELGHLERGVRAAIEALAPGGRLAVLTFHSGEDRVVKRAMQEAAREQRTYHADGRISGRIAPKVKEITRKPVEPGDAEKKSNPRSKSAKLRVVERAGDDEP